MLFSLTSDQVAIRTMASEFAAEKLAPKAIEWGRRDATRCHGNAALRPLQCLGRGQRRFLRYHQHDSRQTIRAGEASNL
jgi:hypothetical protein